LNLEGQQPKSDPLADRKNLTFEQAEGVEPLPQQLRLGELSPAFRAAVWNVILKSINEASHRDSWGGGPPYVRERWESILRYRHIYRLHKPADEFSNTYGAVCAELKPLIMTGNYVQVLGFLEL
jgi:hypothetical protein